MFLKLIQIIHKGITTKNGNCNIACVRACVCVWGGGGEVGAGSVGVEPGYMNRVGYHKLISNKHECNNCFILKIPNT